MVRRIDDIYPGVFCAEKKVTRLAEAVYMPYGPAMELVNTSEHLMFTEGLSRDPTASFWKMYALDSPMSTMLFTPDHPTYSKIEPLGRQLIHRVETINIHPLGDLKVLEY